MREERDRERERRERAIASQPKHAVNNLLNISQPGRGRRLAKSCHDRWGWKSPSYTKQIQLNVEIPFKTALFSRTNSIAVRLQLHDRGLTYATLPLLHFTVLERTEPYVGLTGFLLLSFSKRNQVHSRLCFYNAIPPLEFLNLSMVLNDEIFVGSNRNHFVTTKLDVLECFWVAEAQIKRS